MVARKLRVHVDTLLIANQVSRVYEAKDEIMVKYLERAKVLIEFFDTCEVVHASRTKNKKPDALSKLASIVFQHLAKDVRVIVLHVPSIAVSNIFVIEEDSWMNPFIKYILHDVVPKIKLRHESF